MTILVAAPIGRLRGRRATTIIAPLMEIHLLRHGTAADAVPGTSDAERALTAEGLEKLRRAAPTWRRLVDAPAVILVSPLLRARETAAAFAEAVRFRGEMRTEDALRPDAPPTLAANLLEAEALSGCRSIAVVGHEPHLGYLFGLLVTGHPRQPIPLKKGMLVSLATESSASLTATLRFVLSQRAAGDLA